MTRVLSRDVSRETAARLAEFAAAVERWNPAINLVSRASLPDLWQRHVLDAAQLVDLAPSRPVHWADLGSGGGFPGLVVGIILAETSPETRVTLVEADRRKAAFLMTTVQRLGLSVDIRAERIEAIPPLGADVLSARALAPMGRLVPMVVRHLAPGGTALLPKGAQVDAELRGFAMPDTLALERLPSATGPDATILRIRRRFDA